MDLTPQQPFGLDFLPGARPPAFRCYVGCWSVRTVHTSATLETNLEVNSAKGADTTRRPSTARESFHELEEYELVEEEGAEVLLTVDDLEDQTERTTVDDLEDQMRHDLTSPGR